jgi:hypothetical protein
LQKLKTNVSSTTFVSRVFFAQFKILEKIKVKGPLTGALNTHGAPTTPERAPTAHARATT